MIINYPKRYQLDLLTSEQKDRLICGLMAIVVFCEDVMPTVGKYINDADPVIQPDIRYALEWLNNQEKRLFKK